MILATLLYITNIENEYLLMKRSKNPNKGLFSPPGGKLDTASNETPAECAVREAYEECSLKSETADWSQIGIISEKDFPGAGDIKIFLMKYKKTIDTLPAPCNEGEFRFVHPDNFSQYEIPETDRLFIWDRVLNNGGENFFISLDCSNYPEIKEIKS